MAVSASISIWAIQPTPDLPQQVFVQFDDGMGRFFDSPAAMRQHLNDLIDIELARLLCLAKAINVDPNFQNSGNITNKVLTVDMTQNNIVTYSVKVP